MTVNDEPTNNPALMLQYLNTNVVDKEVTTPLLNEASLNQQAYSLMASYQRIQDTERKRLENLNKGRERRHGRFTEDSK